MLPPSPPLPPYILCFLHPLFVASLLAQSCGPPTPIFHPLLSFTSSSTPFPCYSRRVQGIFYDVCVGWPRREAARLPGQEQPESSCRSWGSTWPSFPPRFEHPCLIDLLPFLTWILSVSGMLMPRPSCCVDLIDCM